MTNFNIFDSLEEISTFAAKLFFENYLIAIEKKGRFSVVLSGGSTPILMYHQLVSNYAERIDWTKVDLFWGDERNVGPDHIDSNYGSARINLINKLPNPPNIYRIKGELPANQAAEEYQKTIEIYFNGAPTSFDLLFLGIGEDGHTASLFPNTKALLEKEKLSVENYVEQLDSWRITMTYKIINQAKNIAFLVSGTNKADIIQKIFSENTSNLPATNINAINGKLIWFLDKNASQKLDI